MVDEDFNYETFYNNNINYFEVPGSPGKAAKIKIPALVEQVNTCQVMDLICRVIFGCRNVADYRPLRPEALFVACSCM